jgi:putative membrane protein
MKFWLRWLANGVAIFLGLYLVDSLLHGRFRLEATWAAVVAAIFLGFVNSFVRPLHRARSKPLRASLVVVLTVVVNAILLQIFVWVGADVSSQGFLWVLLAAAFVTLLTGLINWLVGFNRTERPRPVIRQKPAPGSKGSNGRKQGRD